MQLNPQDSALIYQNYWQRKQLLQKVPRFKCLEWYLSESLCPSEKTIFKMIKNKKDLLDIGAGDLYYKKKFEKSGFRGVYDTLDIGTEYSYTYQEIEQVKKKYEAILLLDVLEHLPIAAGLRLLQQTLQILAPGGVMVIQTPNAKCIRSPYAWDMSHLHSYSLVDLWTYLTAMQRKVQGHRVEFVDPNFNPWKSCKRLLKKWLTTQILGVDYADNILLFVE